MLIVSPAVGAPGRPVQPVHEQANGLVHVAWRAAMGAILRPDTADGAHLLAGVAAAREAARLLRAATPNRPDEDWLQRAARAVDLGAANLQRGADLFTRVPAHEVDRAALVAFAEQAEGDFDFAWAMIAADT